jgi:hypothetical protein
VWGKLARDFPLEEDGFEPSVPLYILTVSGPSCRIRSPKHKSRMPCRPHCGRAAHGEPGQRAHANGFDYRVHLFDCRFKLGPFGNSGAHLAGMCQRRIAEITRGFAQTPPFGTIICTLSSLTTSLQNSDSSLTVPTLPPIWTLWSILKGKPGDDACAPGRDSCELAPKWDPRDQVPY